jgi:hypothetical protein
LKANIAMAAVVTALVPGPLSILLEIGLGWDQVTTWVITAMATVFVFWLAISRTTVKIDR